MTCADGKSKTRTQGSPTGHITCFLLVGLCGGHGCYSCCHTQASAAGNKGESGDLQGFHVYHPPTCMGRGNSMVRTDLAIKREVDDIRGIRDMGIGTKRKEDQSSSNSGKKQKTSLLHESWGQGRGH